MSDTVIKVENLSKKYVIKHQQAQQYTALRDVIADGVKSIGRRLTGAKQDSSTGSTKEEFWALKDVSFEVKQGDRLGIIGRNGAGKSTLLKILSRIVEPTTGEITLNGRVASLLEVGTGFHPELTGRENIYLNGAVLGMSRLEIRKKFDEIVEFAEVDKFLDTPVKRYSSGMYVRLAFAVASHLEPEILIIDEVLAVGDARFQKKCLGKMEKIGETGRTVIYVSHNMDTVTRLCNSVILLRDGISEKQGDASKVIDQYMQISLREVGIKKWESLDLSPGNNIAKLHQVRVHDQNEQIITNINICKPFAVEIIFEVLVAKHILIAGFNFYNSNGINLFDSHEQTEEWRFTARPKGIHKCRVWIPENFLAEGLIQVGVAVFTADPFTVHFHEHEVLTFNIYDDLTKDSARGSFFMGSFPGLLRPKLRWDSTYIE
jgi:lipopolysaccharide transport system ATP-binding protein